MPAWLIALVALIGSLFTAVAGYYEVKPTTVEPPTPAITATVVPTPAPTPTP